MSYEKKFRVMSRNYLEARMEYDQAAKLATRELKPEKNRLEKRKAQVDQVFAENGYSCVYDEISRLYVIRTPSSALQPLTADLMARILEKLEALDQAKSESWGSIEEGIQEAIDVIVSMRRTNKYTISVRAKPPSKSVQIDELTNPHNKAWLHEFINMHQAMKAKDTNIAARKKELKSKYENIESDVKSMFDRNSYVSIPIRFSRNFSKDFVDVVALTGSDFMASHQPRKTHRFLEYTQKKVRNTTVKKFNPSQKAMRGKFQELAKQHQPTQRISTRQLTQTLFKELQAETQKANEEKIKYAMANPVFQLKVSKKKSTTKSKKKKSFSGSKRRNYGVDVHTKQPRQIR